MRTCKKCGETKPEGEFYRHADANDGLDVYCKPCRMEDSKSRYGKKKLARSTEYAMKLLMRNGIPATTGKTVGRPGKDMVAYGYLSFEAKSAESRPKHNVYVFGFTKAQLEYRCDYYVLIFKDIERVFVIPGDSEALDRPGQALCIAPDDPRIAEYENAYHIIKQRVIDDIQAGAPIHSVDVYTGTEIYHVTSS